MKAKNSKRKTHSKRGVENSEPILVECSISQLSIIDALISTSNLSELYRQEIEREINGFISNGRAEEIINYLTENQLCPIDHLCSYNQTDIINKLKQIK